VFVVVDHDVAADVSPTPLLVQRHFGRHLPWLWKMPSWSGRRGTTCSSATRTSTPTTVWSPFEFDPERLYDDDRCNHSQPHDMKCGPMPFDWQPACERRRRLDETRRRRPRKLFWTKSSSSSLLFDWLVGEICAFLPNFVVVVVVDAVSKTSSQS
jgi:hypothetical protein